MKKEFGTVTDREGDVAAGAEVYVRFSSGGNLATLYSDDGITEISNPTTTDNNGYFEFYAADGVYKYQFFVGGVQQLEVDGIKHFDDEDNEIKALRGVTSAANKGFYFTGSGSGGTYDLTSVGRTFGALTDPGADRIAFWDDSASTAAWLTLGAGLTIVGDEISTSGGGSGQSWKTPVRVATTGAGTLASDFENGDTVDGVVLATGNRILIKDQAAPAENGIYVVAASGAPTRATDLDAGAEFVSAAVFVSAGTVNHDTQWTCTNDVAPTLGVTAITWVQIASGAGLLQSSQNLLDVSNVATARTNLGIGTAGTLDVATTAQYRANTADKILDTDGTWGAADYVALVDAATVAVDLSTGFNFSLTIGGNRTLGAPSNTKNGQIGAIVITQDGTGSRTLAYHANWKFAGGTDPVLSTAAGSVDVLFYQVVSSTVIIASLSKAFA